MSKGSNIKVKYNFKVRNIKDITPETLVDIDGKLQSEHNDENTVARNKLERVGALAINNRAKISELEKLTIKQQTEIDFIKNTPTGFDLATTELFQNEFGTVRDISSDGIPSADILTDVYAPRSDGNFEFGILKNPRTKYLGASDSVVNLNGLFGTEIHDIHYGDKTGSIWIITSDGTGKRGYLYRCSPQFINGNLNILQYWILNELGGTREYYSVAESYYDGKITLFVGVSDETGAGAHYINRYRLNHNTSTNIITVADGTELIAGVAYYKSTGDILDGEVSTTIADLAVERVDISEPGYMRGMEIVNDRVYMIINNDTNNSEEEIDKPGYSFIRRIKITTFGVLASGANTFKYKLDDILEDTINQTRTSGGEGSWEAVGITVVKTQNSAILSDYTQSKIDSIYNNDPNSKKFYIAAQHRGTVKKKRIFKVDFNNVETLNSTNSLYRMTVIDNSIPGFTASNTKPFITMSANYNILEVAQISSTNKTLAIHEMNGFDTFLGNIKYAAKVKRYFNIENYHAQLAGAVEAVAVNQQQAFTSIYDNEFSFYTAGNVLRERTVFSQGLSIINYHPFYNGEPLFSKPLVSFYIDRGDGNGIDTVTSLTIQGTVTSGTALIAAYKSGSAYLAIKANMSDILTAASAPKIGTDISLDYDVLPGASIPIIAGNIGAFDGNIAYDPIMSKLWVGTTSGFIHNIDIAGGTLAFDSTKSIKVIKLYDYNSQGQPTDGSKITGLTVFANQAYISQYTPDASSAAPKNSIIRRFDLTKSTATQPFSNETFAIEGLVKDMEASSVGLFATTTSGTALTTQGKSFVYSILTKQFNNDVFESTEVFDEFNFFKNPINLGLSSGTISHLGYNVTTSKYFEREKAVNEYQNKEWTLPKKGLIFGLHNTAALTSLGKLQIVDFSDVNNPQLWAEFNVSSSTNNNPALKGVSGSILHGSGQIDAVTFINDKMFVGRRNSGYGTSINVIDFANNNAFIIVDRMSGNGDLYSGMQFGYKNVEPDKTGNLNERNNADFHYSGLVNPNIKVGNGKINSMDSSYVKNKINENLLVPYVIVGRDSVSNSGGVDIINANTLESIVGIGPSKGSVKKVWLNNDGSAFAAINGAASGEVTIWKINDIRLIPRDGSQYVTDFLAQEVRPYYPNEQRALNLTDMKVQHYIDTLGVEKNIIYATFADYTDGTNGRTMAVKFNYETVAEAGGAVTNPAEFSNNVEVIYHSNSTSGAVTSIDYMDDRIFLSFYDNINKFKMATLKRMPFNPDTSLTGFSNDWFPVLGQNGQTDRFIDYTDLNYNGIKMPINNLNAVQNLSMVFANTDKGSVLFKFPFVTKSKWESNIKPIVFNANAVALARDVFIQNGDVTETIDRNDSKIKYQGSWTEETPSVVVPFSAPLYDRSIGLNGMGAKLSKSDGTNIVSDFKKYQPFTFSTDAGISIFYDGVDIQDLAYDYNSNVLMTEYAEPVKTFDFFDTNSADWKTTYKNSKQSTITMRDSDTTVTFFSMQSGSLTNATIDHQSEVLYELNVSQVPTVSVYAFGKQLATIQNEETIGQSLATTQKLLEITNPDGTKTPVDRVIVKGKNNKPVKSVKVSTYNVSIPKEIQQQYTYTVDGGTTSSFEVVDHAFGAWFWPIWGWVSKPNPPITLTGTKIIPTKTNINAIVIKFNYEDGSTESKIYFAKQDEATVENPVTSAIPIRADVFFVQDDASVNTITINGYAKIQAPAIKSIPKSDTTSKAVIDLVKPSSVAVYFGFENLAGIAGYNIYEKETGKFLVQSGEVDLHSTSDALVYTKGVEIADNFDSSKDYVLEIYHTGKATNDLLLDHKIYVGDVKIHRFADASNSVVELISNDGFINNSYTDDGSRNSLTGRRNYVEFFDTQLDECDGKLDRFAVKAGANKILKVELNNGRVFKELNQFVDWNVEVAEDGRLYVKLAFTPKNKAKLRTTYETTSTILKRKIMLTQPVTTNGDYDRYTDMYVQNEAVYMSIQSKTD
jgi:hypothetical protein